MNCADTSASKHVDTLTGEQSDTATGAIPAAILVTGANGQLGTELQRLTWPAGTAVVAIDIADLDLTDTAAIQARVAAGHDGQPFAAVINGAAYTAVDKAESDLVTTWAVNAMAPAAFGKA